jgi:hypothetical protein
LEYPGARRAFKRLVKGGANPGILENLLMLRVIFGDLPEYKHWLPARRSVNSMSAKMRALALQIRELNRFPGIFAEFSGDRVSSANTDQRLDIPVRSERLGEMLIRYAQTFDAAISKKRPKNATAGRNRSLCRLAEYIRTVTGEKNYADLATLLNAREPLA